MDKLVSVFIPCYNSEFFLPKLFDSLLNQTHKKIEVIAVDDGSTDGSQNVFDAYTSKFKASGINFIVIKQVNSGQAVAINKALKVFKGDYLTWIDSDDWLDLDALRAKVEFLENNENFGFVRTDVAMYKYPDYKKVIGLFSDTRDFKNTNIFLDLILEKNVYFCPGGYLVKREALLDVLPDKHIIESRAGQNWQLLLPLAKKYKCGYINKPLFSYLVRDSSHSHSVVDLEEKINRCKVHRNLILDVIRSLGLDIKYYEALLDKKYENTIISLCYKYRNLPELKQQFKKFKVNSLKSYCRLFVLSIKNILS
ncbi:MULTISPECIES: glycosyltransferase family 2 protein [Pseudoalteromonas]|uniref:glycosyltransferase family 2 protein n=1 Tax=Pseudoalteromonas TaxID=53246 RepID=UPI000C32D939|nr:MULTISPECIES: glycosyltransferase family A protein [Pseudoalteromonas]PKG63482.1 glycosyltransferase family 2 protein [Pseudoalteromonas arctica]PKG68738.1 glycosyltransferase family 2 protein [Pseudoalteromonas sp. GutCa3]